MNYEIKNIHDIWTVIGYQWDDPFEEEPSKPDYKLILVGMHDSLDSPDSIVAGIYRETYDMTQCTTNKIENGTTFHIAPTTIKNRSGSHKIPEQLFTFVLGYHLEWTTGRPEGCTL